VLSIIPDSKPAVGDFLYDLPPGGYNKNGLVQAIFEIL
jgi:hypothetical protein